MADDLRLALADLLRKTDLQDADFLRGVRVLAQAMMELEVSQHGGAERYGRSPDRRGERNGYDVVPDTGSVHRTADARRTVEGAGCPGFARCNAHCRHRASPLAQCRRRPLMGPTRGPMKFGTPARGVPILLVRKPGRGAITPLFPVAYGNGQGCRTLGSGRDTTQPSRRGRPVVLLSSRTATDRDNG